MLHAMFSSINRWGVIDARGSLLRYAWAPAATYFPCAFPCLKVRLSWIYMLFPSVEPAGLQPFHPASIDVKIGKPPTYRFGGGIQSY